MPAFVAFITEWQAKVASTFPDTEVDRRAFERAKTELGTTDMSRLLARAQEIKNAMKGGTR